MSPRIKKLVGFLGFLPFLGLYFAAAAALGARLPDNNLLQLPYYLIAGIAWAFPVKYLMLWMNSESTPTKPKASASAPKRDAL